MAEAAEVEGLATGSLLPERQQPDVENRQTSPTIPCAVIPHRTVRFRLRSDLGVEQGLEIHRDGMFAVSDDVLEVDIQTREYIQDREQHAGPVEKPLCLLRVAAG